MSGIKYIYTVDGISFEIFSYAVKFIGCTEYILEKAILRAEEEGEDNFTLNGHSVNIQVIKPKNIYVKYITNSELPIYLHYIIHINGEKQLIKTMGKDSFNKLEVELDDVIDYNQN